MVDYKNSAFGLLLEKAYMVDSLDIDVPIIHDLSIYGSNVIESAESTLERNMITFVEKLDSGYESGFFFTVGGGSGDALRMEDYIIRVLNRVQSSSNVVLNEVLIVEGDDKNKNLAVDKWNGIVDSRNIEFDYNVPSSLKKVSLLIGINGNSLYSLDIIGNSPVGLEILRELISRVVNGDFAIDDRLIIGGHGMHEINESVKKGLGLV